MQVVINGKKKSAQKNQVLTDFMKQHKIKMLNAVVEYNGKILSKKDLVNTKLKGNDKIEVISFVGGG